MKYVGIVTIDDRNLWSEWHSGSTSRTYRSDGYNTREEAQTWINSQLSNIENEDNRYKIDTLIAQFDEKDIIGGYPKIDYIFNHFLHHGNVRI